MGRYLIAAALLAVIAGPVFAQEKMSDDPIVLERIQKKKDAEALDKQYNATVKNTHQPVAPVKNDPWADMRGTDNSKTKR